MINVSKQLFASDVTAKGPWTDISGYDAWSIQIDQAEASAVFTVEIRNDAAQPPATVSGFDLNAASLLISAGTGFFGPKAASMAARWLRVTKTQASSPIVSTAILFGKTFPM